MNYTFDESCLVENGAHGRIYRAQQKGSNRKYAVKKMNLQTSRNSFRNEYMMAQLTRKLSCCVKTYKSFTLSDDGFIVMELLKSDLLDHCLNNKLSEKDVAVLFYKCCKAVEELHSARIAHLDLKPENILLSETNDIKLCDFGCSTTFVAGTPAKIGTSCGTLFYAAPEISKEDRIHADAADVWSLGVMLHVMLTNCFPFVDGKWEGFPTEENLSLLNLLDFNYSFNCHSLMNQILVFDPTKRLTISQILAHPWFAAQLEDSPCYQPKSSLKTIKSKLKRFGNILRLQSN